MGIQNIYKSRPVRFIELNNYEDWRIEIYSISERNEFVPQSTIENVKQNLSTWLQKSTIYLLNNYKIATLIVHEGKEGNFGIINWWIDENMLQQFVYLATNEAPNNFELYSQNGITTCVWEMAVLWFERNAWVEFVLKKVPKPDFKAYLNQHLNADV